MKLISPSHQALLTLLLTLSILSGCETVAPVSIDSIEVTAPATSLHTGQSMQLSATAWTSGGQVVTGTQFEWTSDNLTVASVSVSGVVSGLTPGNVTIRAAAGGKSGEIRLSIERTPVASVTIEPSSPPTLQMGSTLQLQARVRDGSGNLLTDRHVAWSSNNTSVAQVNSSGLVSAVGVGSTIIIATSENRSGQVTVQVTPPPFAVALADGRVRIHPLVVQSSGFDLTKPLWVAWMGNQFLYRFESEQPYQGLTPSHSHRVHQIGTGENTGWFETAVPVLGSCFTLVQFNGTNRIWANLAAWTGATGIYTYQGRSVMKLPDDGRAAERLNSLISVSMDGDYRNVFLSHAVLSTDELTSSWKLVGDFNNWNHSTGRAVVTGTDRGYTFHASGLQRFTNANATSSRGTSVWGLFGHFGDGSIDLTNAGCAAAGTGYKHPHVRVVGSSAGVWLDPEMPPRLPHLFVDGNEGKVWWPNPNAPHDPNIVGSFKAATPWITAVDDMRALEPSSLEVDYLKLWAVVNGIDVLIAENTYDDGRVGGSLATRDWFKSQSTSAFQARARTSGGILRLPLSDVSDRAWHVWLEDTWHDASGTAHFRKLLPPNTERVWIEARFRIRGAAALQIGWDYYRTTNDIGCRPYADGLERDGYCEAGKSVWFFETFDNDGWQTRQLGR